MANYYGAARSNYIRWDQEKLAALGEIFEINIIPRDDGTKAIISTDDGGTPTTHLYDVDIDDPEDRMTKALMTLGILPSYEERRVEQLLGKEVDLPEELDFLDVVHRAFAKRTGGHFVWMWSGNEAGRYIDGGAIVMNSKGKVLKSIYLNDIHKTSGVKTMATY